MTFLGGFLINKRRSEGW